MTRFALTFAAGFFLGWFRREDPLVRREWLR